MSTVALTLQTHARRPGNRCAGSATGAVGTVVVLTSSTRHPKGALGTILIKASQGGNRMARRPGPLGLHGLACCREPGGFGCSGQA